jgi:MFS family permease
MEFATLFSACFVAPISGLLGDRWGYKSIFIGSQILAMIQAFLMFILLYNSSTPNIYHIIGLCFILGISNGFEFPVRQAFVVDLVEDRRDLSNAIALNSLIFNGTRLLGPPIAGILISIFDEKTCFLINGISYIAIIFTLIPINTQPKVDNKSKKKIMFGILEGLKYGWENKAIRVSLLLLSLFSFSSLPIITFLPLFSADVLHGTSKTLGYLMGGSGIGACLGGFYLMARKNIIGLEKEIQFSTTAYGISLIIFTLSTNFALSLICMIFTGYNMIIIWVATNTVIQEIVDDKMRGRIMSLYIMAFMGAMPIGSFIFGNLSRHYPLPKLMTLGGIFCLFLSLWYAKAKEHVRYSLKKKIGNQ